MSLSWERLLGLAVEMEKRGRDFYSSLSTRVDEPEIRQALAQMAAEEEEHAAVFTRKLAGREMVLPEEDGEYLKALIDDLAQRTPAEIRDPRQAWGVAVEMEKDSILFYTELAGMVEDEEAKKVLYDILRVEKLHLVEVRERLDGEG